MARKKPKSNRKPGPMDNCQTPPYALDPLIPILKSANFHLVWEPAMGEGYLTDHLAAKGFKVHGTDITHDKHFDFFRYAPPNLGDIDVIVTNPPYSIKFDWTQRCYQLGKPFALLMPVEFLGTVGGGELFDRYGIQVIMLRPRVNFKMPNKGWEGKGAQFPVAWYTWKLGLNRDLSFVRINRKTPEQIFYDTLEAERNKNAGVASG